MLRRLGKLWARNGGHRTFQTDDCKVRVTNGLPCELVVRSPAPFPAREAKAGAPVPP